MALEQLQEVFGPLVTEQLKLNGVGADEKGSRAQLGSFRSQQRLANGAGQGGNRPPQTNHPGAKVGERDAIQMAPI